MKTFNIILFIILQSSVSIVFSQEVRDGFNIYTERESTWFEDVNRNNYRGFPIKNKSGKTIGNPSTKLSSKEQLKRIERELYSEEEQNHILTHYKPVVIFSVRANDGKIVSVSFNFDNLTNPSVIDTKKLQILQKRIKAELSYENLLFNGEKAISGYMLASVWLFRP